MDIRKVKKLIELLEASDVAEIEIKEGEEAVRISRAPSASSGLESSWFFCAKSCAESNNNNTRCNY